jgi:hypothetical protein
MLSFENHTPNIHAPQSVDMREFWHLQAVAVQIDFALLFDWLMMPG